MQFWLLSSFLVLVFMMGGSSRLDVQSLFILQPLAVFMCGIAVIMLKRDQLAGRRWLLGGIGAMFLLTLAHALELPDSFARSLPGREGLAEIDKLAGIEGAWRALTLTPENGWNAFFTLFAPLAVILFGIQLNRDDLYRLMPLLIGLGSLSGIFGLLQAIGSPDGPLYLYQITNSGSAVGLFANRNHAAVLLACMFPMLAVYACTGIRGANEKNSRELFAAAIAIVLVPLILVTGSRSGLLIAAFGLLGAAALYRRPSVGRHEKRAKDRFSFMSGRILGGIAVAALGFLTVFFSRAQAIERLFEGSSGEDNRLDFWTASIELFWAFFPWGSGAGSFADAFRTAEPAHLLDATYLNRAHNDWIEIAVTLGIPGILLLTISALFYLRRTTTFWLNWSSDRRSAAIARMAGIAIAMIAAASLSDYPLRTPTMMCVFAMLVLWFGGATGNDAEGKSDPNNI